MKYAHRFDLFSITLPAYCSYLTPLLSYHSFALRPPRNCLADSGNRETERSRFNDEGWTAAAAGWPVATRPFHHSKVQTSNEEAKRTTKQRSRYGYGRKEVNRLSCYCLRGIGNSSRIHDQCRRTRGRTRFSLTLVVNTEPEVMICTWLGETASCSCLTALPGPVWVLRSKICLPLFWVKYKNKLMFII